MTIEDWLETLDALFDRECILEVLIAEARRDALRAQYRGRGDVEALSRHDIAYRERQDLHARISDAAREVALLRQERMAKLDALFEENASEEEP